MEQPLMTDYSADPEIRLEFPFGIPGFESCRHFTLSPIKDHDPFTLLQSSEDADITLILINTRYLKVWEGVKFSAGDLRNIQADGVATVDTFAILKIDAESGVFTANLRAPLVVNRSKNLGMQTIIDDSSLPVDHPLVPIANQE